MRVRVAKKVLQRFVALGPRVHKRTTIHRAFARACKLGRQRFGHYYRWQLYDTQPSHHFRDKRVRGESEIYWTRGDDGIGRSTFDVPARPRKLRRAAEARNRAEASK